MPPETATSSEQAPPPGRPRRLLARDEAGDAARAEALLSGAIAAYPEIGMPKHREIAQAMRAGV